MINEEDNDSSDEFDMDDEEWPDPVFSGNCTCDHEPEEHGYIGCNVDECPCEACWEE